MSPRILHPPVTDLPSALARTTPPNPPARVSAVGVEQADQGSVGRTIALGRPTLQTSVTAIPRLRHDDASRVQEIAETPATVPHLRVLGGAVAKPSKLVVRDPKMRAIHPFVDARFSTLDVQLGLAHNTAPDAPTFADYLRAVVRAMRAGNESQAKAYRVLAMRLVDHRLAELREPNATEAPL